MRKALLAAGLAALMAMPVMAEDVATLAEKIDRVDEVLYGSVQSGSLIGRADQADNVIYGVGNTSASGLDHRIDNLYADVVRNDNDRTPAISNRMNAMEYYLTDEISTDNLTVRMDNLEKAVLGEAKKGALDERMQSLEQAVYGEQHYEMKTVQLPADTVFKVSLNDDVGSKTSQVGDPVSFTVQEDVLVGDVLVLPRGTQGSGVVTEVSRPKSFGRSGKVDVSFDQVFSVDDEAIPTVLGPEAKEKLKWKQRLSGPPPSARWLWDRSVLWAGFLSKVRMLCSPLAASSISRRHSLSRRRGWCSVKARRTSSLESMSRAQLLRLRWLRLRIIR